MRLAPCLLALLVLVGCARDPGRVTVAPRGSAAGLDGIILDAGHAGLLKRETFMLERVDPDALGLPPIGEWATPITTYYRLSHPEHFSARREPLIINVPTPADAPPGRIGVAVFLPEGSSLHPVPAHWATLPTNHYPHSDRAAFRLRHIPQRGHIFTIVSISPR